MAVPPYHPFKSAEAKENFLAFYDMSAKKIWPIYSETRIVETSYGQTFVRIGGAKDAQPLVLLHGAGGDSLIWRQNIKILSTQYKTFAVDDIYGCGRSIDTATIRSADDYVTWLNELFDGLDLGSNINLMGMSYGGWLVCQYALRLPERLGKIVLFAPAATAVPLRIGFILRFALCMIFRLPFILRHLMLWLYKDLAHQGDTGQKLAEECIDRRLLALQCFKSRPLVRPTVLTDEELQSFKMPILLLIGENEKIYSAQKAVQRVNQIKSQIRAEIIPHAGHLLIIEQADLVNSKVLEFLKQP